MPKGVLVNINADHLATLLKEGVNLTRFATKEGLALRARFLHYKFRERYSAT
jgi:hypothetical protein